MTLFYSLKPIDVVFKWNEKVKQVLITHGLMIVLPRNDITIEIGLHELIQDIRTFNCHPCRVNADIHR